MAEQNPIKYSDLITPDDSIEKLIGQLQQLQEAYDEMAKTVKSQAKELADSLKTVSGATAEGKKKIKESNTEAAKLEKAYKRLEEAMSANGKEIQRLNRTRQEYISFNFSSPFINLAKTNVFAHSRNLIAFALSISS